ncbi:phenylalanyl-tRNA synthetase mitochondrial precursor [Lasiosphaeria miniovina]|uniref:Phenylalanine--tRNA ligase, mitochondrial n=1 Tax=Lasiosphaeria miniovina TaxID=1954250 RepID=A0AA39ZZF3_9PEZI|nr:phenylalanyl-tRNA synthetase mitochondrial precursor [Lasiosphaeria miniovina]KAK0706409.1 phenylalanyl-tRNA synthetase mitochondrial precursor [Lasiosphaeria miniovina]
MAAARRLAASAPRISRTASSSTSAAAAARPTARCTGPARRRPRVASAPSPALAEPVKGTGTSSTTSSNPATVEINGKTYATDSWFNAPANVLASTSRKLHLQKDHPVSITRQILESKFPRPTFKYHNDFDPVVSTVENFDSLGFPPDHPGRNRSDTYYINKDMLLRTHTSAHEAALFRASESDGYLISADVYRRDEVDRSHYPVFHQMEGARVWDRAAVPGGDVAAAVYADLARLPTHDIPVEDPNPPFDPERNPLQAAHHTPSEAEAVAAHLKRSLELMVVEIFTRAKAAAARQDPNYVDEPLRVRWVEAYFPFTSPSWELEVYYAGDWLEVLGCGVTQQQILIDAQVPSKVGWAFGIGLDRIAMLLFQIPDIRLFWSRDDRFLGQFAGVSDDLARLRRFVPFSKYPACYKDVSFWLRSTLSAAGGNSRDASAQDFHENDLMEIVRDIAGDTVEDVALADAFTHPKTGRRSMCYRVNYRSLERTLTNAETNRLHDQVTQALVDKLGIEIR